MEQSVGNYQPLRIDQSKLSGKQDSLEHGFWNSFKKTASVQEIGAVSHIDFCQQRPHHVAITSSTRVIVYDARTQKVRRTYARFKDKAYSGTFRQDGKLLLAGGEDGIVQVFAADGRTLLRQLKGHQQAVHVVQFSLDRLHIFSGGDDATARYWDLSSGEQLCRLDGHTDYVRAASQSPASQSMWATGGYDHKCKVWNIDTGEEMMSLDHGSPVEALSFHPSGALLISGGGTEVRIWNTLGAGQLLTKLDNFVKTVTALQVFQPRPTGAVARKIGTTIHLLTGSLDGNLRVYNLDSFKMEYISKYASPILSLATSSQGGHLVVGLSDGSWSLRSRKLQKDAPEDELLLSGGKRHRSERFLPPHKFINRGASEKPGAQDYVVQSSATKALKIYDKRLRQFQFREAVDAAVVIGDGQIVAALLEELACRNALKAGLGGRDSEGFVRLLEFCCKQIVRSHSTKVFIATLQRLLRMYIRKMGSLPQVKKAMQSLQFQVQQQMSLSASMQSLEGLMQPIRAAHMSSQVDLDAL